MSGGREIRTKITSVQNTQKITRAMELVAASKMRKARSGTQNVEFQLVIQVVFNERAQKYCKTRNFERRGKNEVERCRNESMEIVVLRIYDICTKMEILL